MIDVGKLKAVAAMVADDDEVPVRGRLLKQMAHELQEARKALGLEQTSAATVDFCAQLLDMAA